jgi:hypothetical protein
MANVEGHAARMGAVRNTYKMLVENLSGRALWRLSIDGSLK